MNPLVAVMSSRYLQVTFEKPGNTWIYCGGKLYDIGTYRRATLANPLAQKAKTAGADIKLPRLFDSCLLEVGASSQQAMAVVAALAHDRDISIGFEITYPDESVVGIVLHDVFAGNFKFDHEYDENKNPQALIKLDLLGKAVSTIHLAGTEPPFNRDNENFKLTHPLLALWCQSKEQNNESAAKPNGRVAVQKTTSMLHLAYNPHKDK